MDNSRLTSQTNMPPNPVNTSLVVHWEALGETWFIYFNSLPIEAKVSYQKNPNLTGLNIDDWHYKQPRGTWNNILTKGPNME